MQAEYTLVRARPALTYALVHSRESGNYNTSRSLRVVGNLCVCFLNIKEGKNRFSGIQETILLVKWPVVLPHLTTFKVKTKYFIVIMVAYTYLEICFPLPLLFLTCIFPISVSFRHADSYHTFILIYGIFFLI